MDNLSLAASDIDRIDDLPRAFTYRRQRAQEAADALSAPEPPAVSALDVSTGRLAIFFLKCAVAALPALALLIAAGWGVAAAFGLAAAELPSIPLPIYAPDASQ